MAWLDLQVGILEEFAARAPADARRAVVDGRFFGMGIENRAGNVDKEAQKKWACDYHQRRKEDPEYRARRAESKRRARLGLPALRGRGRPRKEAA